jgi:hypothetical protein
MNLEFAFESPRPLTASAVKRPTIEYWSDEEKGAPRSPWGPGSFRVFVCIYWYYIQPRVFDNKSAHADALSILALKVRGLSRFTIKLAVTQLHHSVATGTRRNTPSAWLNCRTRPQW